MQQQMRELIDALNAASEAYYGGRPELMTDYEWNEKFDLLARLEEESGIVLPDSPTRNVSTGEMDTAAKKEPHEYPALSLAKTKQIPELQKWAGDLPVYLSWKLDGLTLVATYDGGSLTRLLTRGNGSVGSNITYLKDVIRGVPKQVAYKGHLVVRGEAAISYTDFNAVNDSLPEGEEPYANPRNLASGTLALDAKNAETVAERKLTFYAFTLVHLDEPMVSWGDRMNYLRELGFTTVDFERTDAAGLPDAIARWTERVDSGAMDIPVDGLVICYEDTDYAAGGSVTGHHATRAGFAFKWQDTAAATTLKYIEWSCAANAITPVAVFEPVQLEGTTVSRASLCNLSELDRLGIGADGKTQLQVIKANKIIPKCVAVLSKEGTYTVPDTCPVCGAATVSTESASGVRTLHCSNPDCAAKNLKKLERFVSKHGMDIDGLSIETLRDFVQAGFITGYPDIWSLGDHAEEIRTMDGYGSRSCEVLLEAIEKSRKVHPVKLIYALSIPLVGREVAKRLLAATGWQGFLDRLEQQAGFADIDGIGPEKSDRLVQWYAKEQNRETLSRLLELLEVEDVQPAEAAGGPCEGMTFVITGSVHSFKNREEFKAYVESAGGKVASAVSKATNYLVNNDAASASSKNKKAHDLGIPILTEDEFIARFGK